MCTHSTYLPGPHRVRGSGRARPVPPGRPGRPLQPRCRLQPAGPPPAGSAELLQSAPPGRPPAARTPLGTHTRRSVRSGTSEAPEVRAGPTRPGALQTSQVSPGTSGCPSTVCGGDASPQLSGHHPSDSEHQNRGLGSADLTSCEWGQSSRNRRGQRGPLGSIWRQSKIRGSSRLVSVKH